MNISGKVRGAAACALAIALVCGSGFAQQTGGSGSRGESKKSSGSSTNNKSSGKSSSRSSTASSKKNSSSDKKSTQRSENSQLPAEANQVVDHRAFNAQLLSRLIFDLTNVERQKASMPQFKNNQYLASAAAAHSGDMASRSYFNHKSKGIFKRTDHSERIRATGYTPSMSAENIAMIPTFNSQRIVQSPYGNQVVDTDYNTYYRLASYAVQQWMESPGHRANILNRSLTDLGVGAAVGMQGNVPYVYLTQNFGA